MEQVVAIRSSKTIERGILSFLRENARGDWHAVTLPELGSVVQASDTHELVRTLKRLNQREVLGLKKWIEPSGFVTYTSEMADEHFFYRGGFQLGLTPETAPYLELLEAAGPGTVSSGPQVTMAGIDISKGTPALRNMADAWRGVFGTGLDSQSLKGLRQSLMGLEKMQIEMREVLRQAPIIEKAQQSMRQLEEIRKSFAPVAMAAGRLNSGLHEVRRAAEQLQINASGGLGAFELLGRLTGEAFQAQRINLELPELARQTWRPEVFADRSQLVIDSIRNVEEYQRFQDLVLSDVSGGKHGTRLIDALLGADRFMLHHGQFVRTLPPEIGLDDEAKEAQEGGEVEDVRIGEAVHAALLEHDPKLAQMRLEALNLLKRGDPAAARLAAGGFREIFKDLLHELAPDDVFRSDPMWVEKIATQEGKIYRNNRISYILRDQPSEVKALVQFDKSVQRAHKFTHTFAENTELVRIHVSEMQSCIYLLLLAEREKD